LANRQKLAKLKTAKLKLWPRSSTRLSGQLQIYNTIFHVAATQFVAPSTLQAFLGQLLANIICDMSPVFGSLRPVFILFLSCFDIGQNELKWQ